MNNYEDYELEDMENAAVNKSNNLKKAGLAAGAAVLGAGGVYAATQFGGGSETDDVTAEDLLAGADAGEITDDVVDVAPAQTAVQEEVHVHHHHHIDPAPAAPVEVEPEIKVDETALILDEDGNYVSLVDKGTYDGRAFVVLDEDGNGRGDYLAYDENANGVFEEHEIVELDNQSYEMGQGQSQAVYIQDAGGDLHQVDPELLVDPLAQEDNGFIHNDFDDEHGKEDWAFENPDYSNNENHAYSASMEAPQQDNFALDVDEKYDGGIEATEEVSASYEYDGMPETSYEELHAYDDFTEPEEPAYDAYGAEEPMADGTDFGGGDDFGGDTFDDGSAYMA